MLAQRELQLMSLLEERNSVQAEKDSLKMELQHLERQHYKELVEAQRKADALMVQELSIQRQQLDKEKDEALNSLWTRLTQEHTEELCRLKYAHWTEGEAAASLHRELKAKDQELRQLQMSMDEWKQQTTAHLADSVTEKLIPELESCKSKLISCRNASKIKEASPDGMMHGAKESLEAVCSHLHHAIVCAAGHIHSDVSVFKLLCDLQSRVKQLLIENQVVPDMLNRNFLK
ncbi:PREDICTED: uncharacterized protein LOC107103684 [Cyprinodon variegatus]|uniref:uncharacterized protein LOC107103684 n=1 Tax=Cyprinodon variegatus TaxID=28743 RepID=UPI0007427461|nr:PREDICTED: uncharacterized protein LOC107103684 [Cyprinodon variegatus]